MRRGRYWQRQRKASALHEVLPDLVGAHSRTAGEVVKRDKDGNELVDWSALHPALDPGGASNKAALPAQRAARKRAQIAELLSWATELLPPGGTAVDFCAGSGHVGLVLAAVRPDVVVYIVEKKALHCELAQERADMAGLTNAIVCNCELSDFTTPFDVGLGLHACGPATDLIHSLCLAASASYVLAPCCYGFISKALDSYRLDYIDHNTNSSMVHIRSLQLPPVEPDQEAWVQSNYGTWQGLELASALGGRYFCRGKVVPDKKVVHAKAERKPLHPYVQRLPKHDGASAPRNAATTTPRPRTGGGDHMEGSGGRRPSGREVFEGAEVLQEGLFGSQNVPRSRGNVEGGGGGSGGSSSGCGGGDSGKEGAGGGGGDGESVRVVDKAIAGKGQSQQRGGSREALHRETAVGEEGEGAGMAVVGKGMSEKAAEMEEARLREACVFRARVLAAVRQQEQREAVAPLERTVAALDDMLAHVAGCMGVQGRLELKQHSRHLEEIKRSYWGCGVSYPRSAKFREELDLETFSCLAGR